MMHFALCVNGEEIVKVSVLRRDSIGDGCFRYEWDAWRPDPDLPARLDAYANGEVAHRYDDSIEELAIKVLTAYRDAKVR